MGLEKGATLAVSSRRLCEAVTAVLRKEPLRSPLEGLSHSYSYNSGGSLVFDSLFLSFWVEKGVALVSLLAWGWLYSLPILLWKSNRRHFSWDQKCVRREGYA